MHSRKVFLGADPVLRCDVIVTSLMTLLLLSSGTFGLELSQVDGKSLFQSLLASHCSVNCPIYRLKVRPVCGTDNVTYSSRCELRRAVKCDGIKVDIKHKGKCPGACRVASSPI